MNIKLIAASLAAASTLASADIVSYAQDFEGLNAGSPTALGDDGWLVGANVFENGGFVYNYFAFPAPNGGAAFSGIATGEGGPAQGAQQLSVYNDYNNGDHANPARAIEANFFREYTIGAGNVGETWEFSFDFKRGNIEGGSTALAFIKTLDVNNGFALTNFVTFDTTNAGTEWSGSTLSLTIDASLQGQLFQIGFLSLAGGFEGSGIFYDNINLNVPAPGSVALLGLGGLAAARRRR